jgi:hypothetical protein
LPNGFPRVRGDVPPPPTDSTHARVPVVRGRSSAGHAGPPVRARAEATFEHAADQGAPVSLFSLRLPRSRESINAARWMPVGAEGVMNARIRELVRLALLSAFLCAALMHDQLVAAAVFAALTCAIAITTIALRCLGSTCLQSCSPSNRIKPRRVAVDEQIPADRMCQRGSILSLLRGSFGVVGRG